MKTVLFLVAILLTISVSAQTTNVPAINPAPTIRAELPGRPPAETLELAPLKPNQIRSGPLSYEGIFVEAVKIDNPLQLINPAAPERYGAAEDNLVRDPISKRPGGLKFFQIGF